MAEANVVSQETSGLQSGISTMPTVELISADEVKDKKNTLKVRPFKKYFEAVERIGMVKWIKTNFEKQSDIDPANRIVISKVTDVAKEMGPEFENYGYVTIYSALKYVLFQDGIMLSTGVHKDGSKLFMMREKRPGDKLAASYKYWEERAARGEQIRDEKKSKLLDKLNAKRQKIKEEKVSARDEIRKERDAMYEELRKERNALYEELKKEKRSMTDQIKKYKDLLLKKSEKRLYMVEIFKINWKTLEWKLIKGKTAKSDDGLLDLIRDYASTPDERYRIEITEVENLPEIKETEGEISVVTMNESQNSDLSSLDNQKVEGIEEAKTEKAENAETVEANVQEKIDGANIQVS